MLDVDPLREAIDGLDGLKPERLVVTQQWIDAWFGTDVATYTDEGWEDMPDDPEAGDLDLAAIDVDRLPDIIRATTVPCAPPVVVIEASPAGPTWRTGCDHWETLLRNDTQWFTNEAEELTELWLDDPDDLDTAIRQATAGSDGDVAQYFIVFGESGDAFIEVSAAHGNAMMTVRRTARDWEFPVSEGSTHQDWTGAPTFRPDEIPGDTLLSQLDDIAAEAGAGAMETAYVWVGENGDILGRVVGTDANSDPAGIVLVPAADRT